jgi:hypothetical protein
MDNNEVLNEIKEFFDVKELVDKQTFDKYGEKSWQFLCPMLLHTLLVIRKELGKPITINNWSWGGNFDERGLRTNTCDIVSKKTKVGKLYLSAHCMGKAIDFDVLDMKASEVRTWLVENSSILPYKIRLEHKFVKTGKEISWVHLDVYHNEKDSKVYLFNV